MEQVDAPEDRMQGLVEPKPGSAAGAQEALLRRLRRLERLVAAIEEELADDRLSDEQKLGNIGERVAAATDGR